MATTKFTVHLGGRDREVKYTLDERVQLEGMFPRPDGTPANLWDILQSHFMRPGSFAVQLSVLWVGLRKVESRITLDQVRKWVGDMLVSDAKNATPIFKSAFDAILASGILGFTITEEDLKEAEEGADPKEQPVGTAPKP